jgi:DNA-binding SARP family transcriptional activator
MLRIQTFGGCHLERDGARVDELSGQRKSLALLAVLAGAGARGVTRDSLAALHWPASDEEHARTSLKQLVHSLRRQLGEPGFLFSTSDLRLDGQHVTSDVAEFRDAVRQGNDEAACR